MRMALDATERAMSFARGKEAQARKAAKKNRPATLVPKALGVSRDPRGPVYCEKHLALVRAQQCLITQAHGCVAHHARELVPRTGGKRVTDFLAVPLRPDMHDGENYSLHKTGQKSGNPLWWDRHGLGRDGVFRWLKGFFRRHYPNGHPGVTQALEIMATEEAKNGR